MEEPQVLVPVKLAQGIVDYLKRRPFEEVAEMINGLVRAPRAQLAPPAAPAPAAAPAPGG